MQAIFDERDPKTRRPIFEEPNYLKTAITAGGVDNFLGSETGSDGKPRFMWRLWRNMGLAGGNYPVTQPEGELLDRVLKLARPDFFFMMKIEPGTLLAEVDKGLYPQKFTIRGSRAFLIIDTPNVKLSQLRNVVFRFETIDFGEGVVPENVRIRLVDDTVNFDDDPEITLNWKECDTKRRMYDSNEGVVFMPGLCAITDARSANFDKLLKPLQIAKQN